MATRITVRENILGANEQLAAENRARLDRANIFAVNIMASPGAGKTSLIEQSIRRLAGQVNLAVVDGDIATSIDAMAAGFSLTLLDANPYVACLIIGITTFSFSWAGVLIGRKSGTWLESKAEIFGGTVLVLIGLKILLA